MIDDQDKLGSKIDDLDSPGFLSKFSKCESQQQNPLMTNGQIDEFGEVLEINQEKMLKDENRWMGIKIFEQS